MRVVCEAAAHVAELELVGRAVGLEEEGQVPNLRDGDAAQGFRFCWRELDMGHPPAPAGHHVGHAGQQVEHVAPHCHNDFLA